MDFRVHLQPVKPISPHQFALFRMVLGGYLAVHFAQLIPYGTELFSNQGLLPDAQLNPLSGIFPNPLAYWDSPGDVRFVLLALTGFSSLFMLGVFRHIAAVFLWFGWACLFNRNNLISNPSIPYVGILLLLSTLIPSGEKYSLWPRKKEPWFFPCGVYWTSWFLMAAGYTISGLIKLSSPSWLDGTAMSHVVNNPLARPGLFRDLFLSLPDGVTRVLTWGSLLLEIVFLPLSFNRWTRLGVWTAMIGMHLGILLLVDFADLTIGMLIIHLFTFDPEWKKRQDWVPQPVPDAAALPAG